MSNEELIDNLTKDLRDSCVSMSAENNKSKSSVNTDSIPQNDSNPDDDPVFLEPDSNEENEPLKQDKTEDIEDVEFVDEIGLQDRDSLLSIEEKEEILKEALKLKTDGNEQFRNKDYLDSVISYSKALKICPLHFTNDRSILYANRAASKHRLDRKESAIQDCSKAVELNSTYIKAYLRRATLYEETDKLDEALEDYKKILELDPRHNEAISASMRLPNQINEKNEKMKAEMMDKLKDLGNLVLKPFGLSTNNFKMNKDPNSGGYSINFVQNP